MDVKRLEKTIIINNNSSYPKLFLKILAGLFFLLAIFAIGFPFLFRYYVENHYSQYIIDDSKDFQVDKIIVLGAGYEIVKSRVEKAAQVYKEHPDTIVVLSGANIPSENYYETTFMKELAIADGIDASQIEVDNNSSRTFDTCLNIKTLNKTEGNYVMITQKYHLLRTLFVCREIGVNAYGVIADEDSKGLVETIRTSDDDTLQSLLRETYALTYSIWDVAVYKLIQKNF